MRILLANHHLMKTGGTENYTYALAVELKRRGHDVEYFTFHKGPVSDLIEKEGVPFMRGRKYDLILANHTTCVRRLHPRGFLVQTCHGVTPHLEQPHICADYHVSVTEEVKRHLLSERYQSKVILNGIDCRRFAPVKPVSPELTSVLSLCQSDELNAFLKNCCEGAGLRFMSLNKHTDNVWEVEKQINEADLVIGIGRSLYDAMACGRCVVSYDRRGYMNEEIGDGYITADNIEKSIARNCSGRSFRKTFDAAQLVQEMMKYNPADAEWARNYALEHLNIEKVVDAYLAIYGKHGKISLWKKMCKRVGILRKMSVSWKKFKKKHNM